MIANYENSSMDKKIEVACRLAALSVTKPGTQSSYPGKNDLEDILKDIKM